MSYLFDLGDLIEELRSAKMYSKRFEMMQTMKVNNLKELCGKLPEESEIFFIETRKSFTAFTFIVYTLKQTGRIDNLFIATYSTNDRIINAIVRWYDKGLIGKIHLHMSETIKFRMPKIYQRLQILEANGTITLSFAWTHKKITCMSTPSGYFVVEGSGNYGENALEEQYTFLKSKDIYEFRTGIDKMEG